MGCEKVGGLTGGVLEDDSEDSDRIVGVGNPGGIDCGSSGSAGGQGGINGGCAGRGVWLNWRKYSSSRRVKSSTVDAMGCTPMIGRGFGEWTKAGVVTVGGIVGYGALNDTGASLQDGVRNAADLGCIRRDSGAMNARLASSSGGVGACSWPGHLSQGPKGVDTTAGAKLARGGSSKIGRNGGDALRSRWASLRHPGLVVGVLPAGSSIGGGPNVHDCMLSPVGLEAGSDRWCGLLPSRLEVSRGGIGVVPTSPDEQVLGRGSAGIWGGCSRMVGMHLEG